MNREVISRPIPVMEYLGWMMNSGIVRLRQNIHGEMACKNI